MSYSVSNLYSSDQEYLDEISRLRVLCEQLETTVARQAKTIAEFEKHADSIQQNRALQGKIEVLTEELKRKDKEMNHIFQTWAPIKADREDVKEEGNDSNDVHMQIGDDEVMGCEGILSWEFYMYCLSEYIPNDIIYEMQRLQDTNAAIKYRMFDISNPNDSENEFSELILLNLPSNPTEYYPIFIPSIGSKSYYSTICPAESEEEVFGFIAPKEAVVALVPDEFKERVDRLLQLTSSSPKNSVPDLWDDEDDEQNGSKDYNVYELPEYTPITDFESMMADSWLPY
jgi:uncharacterized coiled-coil protein SlyX